MNITLSAAIAAVACTVALACAHEASAPTAPPAVAVVVPPSMSAPAPPTAEAPTVATSAPPAAPIEKAASNACIEVDSELGGKPTTLEGVVFIDQKHEHPSRGKTRPFILRLDAPRCAVGIDQKHVNEVHLAATDDVSFKALVGKHVRVSGDPFMSHTAWHARPIVLLTSRVTTLP